jgi:hypothetical protein
MDYACRSHFEEYFAWIGIFKSRHVPKLAQSFRPLFDCSRLSLSQLFLLLLAIDSRVGKYVMDIFSQPELQWKFLRRPLPSEPSEMLMKLCLFCGNIKLLISLIAWESERRRVFDVFCNKLRSNTLRWSMFRCLQDKDPDVSESLLVALRMERLTVYGGTEEDAKDQHAFILLKLIEIYQRMADAGSLADQIINKVPPEFGTIFGKNIEFLDACNPFFTEKQIALMEQALRPLLDGKDEVLRQKVRQSLRGSWEKRDAQKRQDAVVSLLEKDVKNSYQDIPHPDNALLYRIMQKRHGERGARF